MASPNKQASSDQVNSNNSNSQPDAFSLYMKWQQIEPSQWQQLDPGIQLDIKRSVEQEFQKVIQKLKEQQRYYFVADPNTDELALFDVTAGLLWDVQYDFNAAYERPTARHRAKAISKFGLENWQVPTLQQLRALHVNSGQLLRSGDKYRFAAASEYWATKEGVVDMDLEPGSWNPTPITGHLMACQQLSVELLVMQSLNQGWLIHSSLNSIGEKWKQALSRNRNDPYWADVIAACKQSPWQMPYLGFGQYFANLDSTSTTLPKLEQNQISDQDKGLIKVPDIGLYSNVLVCEVYVAVGNRVEAGDPLIDLGVGGEMLSPHSGVVKAIKVNVGNRVSEGDEALILNVEEGTEITTASNASQTATNLLSIDRFISPLPVLDKTELTDPNKGLWEFWQQEAPEDYPELRGRNPAEDVQPWPVTIDFGTSSTVVAFKDGGKKRLIRVGVKDFFAPVAAEHFENPTVLEFVDLDKALPPWQQSAYKPGIKWGDLRCSHEALSGLRDNEGDPAVTASILTNLKHWALREGKEAPLRIQDRVNNRELILPPLELKNPVKGQPLSVSSDDTLDPIELYAYYLGLAINWRKRGIFLRYYMTFPVTYPQRIKEKILASFRRGLQRSLPESLINQQVFNDFSVTERASEPAAFAATALPYFGIDPTEEGVAYGVFDFGGGTTDFDFGLYREPSPEEEDEGYEEVFEHFGASGDKFLGGENLLEHLAYEVFKANQALCREKKIAFTKPLDADDFPGSEMLLEKTRAAFTNTQMLMSRLRSYWESREQNNQGIEKLNLINRSGESISCELTLPYDELESFLNQRLAKGVINFFSAMHKAFTEAGVQLQKVHIFLAGNASLSPALQSMFGLNCKGESSEDEQDNAALENPYHQQVAELTDRLFGTLDIDFEVHAPISQSEGNPYQATTKTGVALGLLDLCPGSPVKVVNRAVIAAQGEAPFDHYVGCIKRRMFKPSLKRHTAYGQWHELGPVREGVFTLVSTQSPVANTGTVPQNDPILIHKPLSFAHAQPGERVFARAIAPDQIEITTAEHVGKLQRDDAVNVQRLNLTD